MSEIDAVNPVAPYSPLGPENRHREKPDRQRKGEPPATPPAADPEDITDDAGDGSSDTPLLDDYA